MDIQVYTFTEDELLIAKNNQRNIIRELVGKHIYPKLTDKQKDYISEEDCVDVYEMFDDLVKFTLTVDEYGNVEGMYHDLEPLIEITERFVRCVKAIKRGSVFTSWSRDPNFSGTKEENDEAKRLKDVFNNVMDFDEVFDRNKVKLRGRAKRRVVLNVVFNILSSCDTRPSYVDVPMEETISRIEESIVKVSDLLKRVSKRDREMMV